MHLKPSHISFCSMNCFPDGAIIKLRESILNISPLSQCPDYYTSVPRQAYLLLLGLNSDVHLRVRMPSQPIYHIISRLFV